ncbi:MAG: HEAT repeat domain-containing protein [Pirellulales bacterium]|nr:HEAT repeat domain-containing protein [Pirellulales bacterium]
MDKLVRPLLALVVLLGICVIFCAVFCSTKQDMAASLPCSSGQPNLQSLAQELKNSDRYVRIYAAMEISKFGWNAGPAVPALVAALKDRDSGVRLAAVEALDEVGPDASRAMPAVIAALKDAFPPDARHAPSRIFPNSFLLQSF